MREGWKTMKLDDACFVDYGTRVVRKKDGGTIYPVYGGGGATFQMDIYNRENCLVVARFAMSQTCTRFVQGKFFLNDSGLTLRAKDKDLSQQFLDWIIISKNDLIYSFGKGSAQKNLDMEDFRNMEISFPVSLAEQQRIVDILDQEFAKIDALKTNAEKSLQAAKDLFQATTDTLMSNEQWRELTIGEIAKIKGGKRVPKGYKLEKEPTAHRYIRVADFTDLGTIRTESVLYISDEVYKSIKAYTISSKDVYISIAGTIGKSGIIPDTLDGANLTENACKLVLGPNFYNRFVFFATKTSSFKKQVEALTMQAAQPKLALTRLATIRVRVPSSIKEQETIVERLDGIADTIALLQDNYQKTLTLCDDLKQSLLRKAFIGEL